MKYYYNEETKDFAVTTNFVFKELPQGYKEISQEEFDTMQKKLQKEIEETDNTAEN